MIQGGEGGGHTGPVPTTLLLPTVLDAVDIPVVAAGGFFDGRGLAAALSYGAAGVGMGTRFLLTQDSAVPGRGQAALPRRPTSRHRRHRQGRRDAAPDAAHRPGRVARGDLALKRLGPTARRTLEFKKDSGMSWAALLKDGRAMKKAAGPHPGPDGARRQHPDDAQGRPGRGRHRRRRARLRPGRRRHRRPADLRGADRPDRAPRPPTS